jgi:mRNA interferase RelE/StbE
MDYKIALTTGAEKSYRKFKQKDKSLTKRIDRAFDILSKNPFAGKFLVGELKGYHSYRIGNYRIIYEIIQKEIIVLILKIDKRGTVYN